MKNLKSEFEIESKELIEMKIVMITIKKLMTGWVENQLRKEKISEKRSLKTHQDACQKDKELENVKKTK